jgi:hypothetical protein
MTIITDEAHPRVEDFPVLRRLTTRHDVMVVRIGDTDPLRPEDMTHDVVDVARPREVTETARLSPKVEREAEAFRRARRDGIGDMLDRLHITHVLTAGEKTVTDDMIAMLRAREFRHAV